MTHYDYCIVYPKQMEDWLEYAYTNLPQKPEKNRSRKHYMTLDNSMHKTYCNWRRIAREKYVNGRCYVLYTDARTEYLKMLDFITLSVHVDLQVALDSEIKEEILENFVRDEQ